MLRQFLVAAAVSVCNITIHALVMTVVVTVAQRMRGHRISPSLLLIVIMVATVSVLMVAHASEVVVWAMAYKIVGVVPPPGGSTVYFAFVNYTTLGYGDIVPVQAWQLLGPATAMNGVLLFGWSTAVIFEVLRRAMMLGSPSAA